LERNADLNLGGRYSRVTAVLGVADDSKPGAYADIVVSIDGRDAARHRVALGQAVPLSIDVSGALRLSVLASGPLADAKAAVGRPQGHT
jgi:hypothetical protein